MIGRARRFQPRPLPGAVRPRIIVLIALAFALVGTGVIVRTARAEAPAHWRPLLLAHASDVRPSPPPANGSVDDRRELDEIVAAQASASMSEATFAFWTTAPGVVRWNEILLDTVRLAKTNPVRTSRALALLNTAMYDAVIAACDAKLALRRSAPGDRDGRIRASAPLDDLSSYASVDAAIAAAAVAVLSAIYPGRADDFEARAVELHRVRIAAGTHTASDLAAGTAIGEAVGMVAVARAAADGATAVWQGTPPADPGAWQPARPFRNDQPLEATAGTWRPWLMTSGSQFRPGPPPAFESAEWQEEADELVRVNATLTEEQVRIARFWNDGPGTDTPPGHWMRIAIDLVTRDHLATPLAARVLAHLAMAQADAFIACWDTKYAYWSGRPIGLIPGFASTIVTPNFPSYISGHSTLSGASAVVLSAFFPGDAKALAAQAEEAAVSRLYGGIHWRSDNEAGLGVGREIGQLAVARARLDGSLVER